MNTKNKKNINYKSKYLKYKIKYLYKKQNIILGGSNIISDQSFATAYNTIFDKYNKQIRIMDKDYKDIMNYNPDMNSNLQHDPSEYIELLLEKFNINEFKIEEIHYYLYTKLPLVDIYKNYSSIDADELICYNNFINYIINVLDKTDPTHNSVFCNITNDLNDIKCTSNLRIKPLELLYTQEEFDIQNIMTSEYNIKFILCNKHKDRVQYRLIRHKYNNIPKDMNNNEHIINININNNINNKYINYISKIEEELKYDVSSIDILDSNSIILEHQVYEAAFNMSKDGRTTGTLKDSSYYIKSKLQTYNLCGIIWNHGENINYGHYSSSILYNEKWVNINDSAIEDDTNLKLDIATEISNVRPLILIYYKNKEQDYNNLEPHVIPNPNNKCWIIALMQHFIRMKPFMVHMEKITNNNTTDSNS